MLEALCRSSGTTLDIRMSRDGPPITQRTSGLIRSRYGGGAPMEGNAAGGASKTGRYCTYAQDPGACLTYPAAGLSGTEEVIVEASSSRSANGASSSLLPTRVKVGSPTDSGHPAFATGTGFHRAAGWRFPDLKRETAWSRRDGRSGHNTNLPSRPPASIRRCASGRQDGS